MTLQPGTKLGAFEITGLLGKGGMGEVYRARDTKLGRDVAIKVVSEAVASDAEYLKRFEREARTLASLDHPNIAAIYEVGRANLPVSRGGSEEDSARQESIASGPPSKGDQGGCPSEVHFLVMQLVEGESLSARIKRGALSVREALPIFIQIARGLDAAHEKGIVHRDLKPANVTLTIAGDAKILDFGIAKDLTQANVDPNAMTTPMTSSPVTGAGTLVGTPHYMSPEQARGKPVDRRTDVWAFGCCLYEALTGDMPFTGETMTDIVAGIIHKDPDWALLPADLPRELDRIVRRCLEKDLRRRPSSTNDLAIALEDVETDLRSGNLDTVRTAPASPTADTSPIRSLVVLPFENLMGDEEQNYLVDGMTEALTAELSKIRALKVTSRGSAMRYRKTGKSMTQIAQELGIDGLIEGSIFRAGEGIRITAQLIDGRSDAHLWSESFTGSMDSMLQLQGDVALAIAKAIQVAVTPEEKKQLRKQRHQISRDVQKVIWEANYAFNQQNPRGYRDAVRLYERAIEMDPECTPAYVGLAAAHWVPSILGIGRPLDALEKAEQASKRALELDSDSSHAQFTAGYIEMMYHHNWEKAREHFDRAVELSSSSAEAYSGRGLWRIALLDFEGAARDEEMARELDPMSPMHANNLGVAYACLERYEEADSQFADAIELSPLFVLGHVNRHAARLWHNPTTEGLNELEQLVELSGKLPVLEGNLAWAYGRLGDRSKAAATARSLENDASNRFIPPLMLGMAFQGAGDEKKAFEYHEKSIDEREWGALYLGACPWIVEGHRRSDPRYRALLEKLKLPESAIRRALNPAAMWPKTTVAQPAQSPRVEPTPRRYQGLFAAAMAVLLVAGGFFAGSLRNSPSTQPSDTNTGLQSAPRIASLAVLPLDNLMEDPEQEYFVDGMTEALTAELSKIQALKVISRTSVMRYKGSDKSAGEIANELGVQGLIEGSVMRIGNEVRITVQLIDAKNDAHLWAETYDNTLTNVFKLHSEVALAIASEVSATVTPSEASRITDAPQVDPAAHEAYLKGLYHYRLTTREGYATGIGYLEEAVAIDPTFALAWTWLATAYLDSVAWGFGSPSLYTKAQEAAQTALALDDSLAFAHDATGYTAWYLDWNWERAEREFRRSIELAPSDGYTRFNLSWLLAAWGRSNEAIKMINEGLDRDPLSLVLNWTEGWVYVTARQPEEAIRSADAAMRLDPDFGASHCNRGHALWQLGRYDGAISSLKRANELMHDPPVGLAWLARAYIAKGDPAAAREILTRLETPSGSDFVDNALCAIVYAGLGDNDEAFNRLNKAYDRRDWWLLALRVDPMWDCLRDDPRFWDLVDRIGFPALPNDNPVVQREREYKEAIAANVNQTIEKIAVLPFANLSGDPEQEYFVDGMTEALTMELARIKALTVISRTSAMQYKGVLRPISEIAGELGADVLVEGSAIRSGERVRITAQLIDGRNDQHLWADRYDGTMEDILKLQGEVALAIAEAIKIALLPEEETRFSNPDAVDPVAYEAYLKGLALLQKFSPKDFEDSVDQLKTATQLAPDFAPAFQALSNAYWVPGFWGFVRPLEYYEDAKRALDRALELDPQLANAWISKAWMLLYFDFDWKGSQLAFERAQELQPNNASLYHGMSYAFQGIGDFDKAIGYGRRAVEADPRNLAARNALASALSRAGQFDEAEEQYQRMIIQDPDYAEFFSDYPDHLMAQRKYAEAEETTARGIEKLGRADLLLGIRARALAGLGRTDEARALVAELVARSNERFVMPEALAVAYAALGDLDNAFVWLNKGVDERSGNVAFPAITRFDDLRSDSRFQDYLNRVDLPMVNQ